MFVSFSSKKLIITSDTPSDEVERSSSMPLMVLTASSILSVTSVSICSGAAPGWTVVTTMVGKSIFGNRSTPKRVNPNIPTTTNDKIRTVAKTGRLTQSAASHCMMRPQTNVERESRERRRSVGNWTSVRELSDIRCRDALADGKPTRDFYRLIDRLRERHDTLFPVVSLDDINGV